jgi:phage terminase large subunit
MLEGRPMKRRLIYRGFGAACELFHCRAPEVLLSGPAGTGKSRACLEKGYWLALRYPRSRGLIARKTRASLTEAALVTWEEKVAGHSRRLRRGPSRANREVYRFPNGSEIVVGGIDRASRVMSTEFDWFSPRRPLPGYRLHFRAQTGPIWRIPVDARVAPSTPGLERP